MGRKSSDHILFLKAVANCKHLEILLYGFRESQSLDFVRCNSSLESFKELKHLRELKIFRVSDYTVKLIKVRLVFSLTLEVLEQGKDDSELMSVVLQLKCLRVLKLHKSNNVDNINLIGELKQLTELSFIDVGAYHFDLIQIVSRLENLTKLTQTSLKFQRKCTIGW